MSSETLNLLGRYSPLFEVDLATNSARLQSLVEDSSFLVIGGAGSIGQAVAVEIFRRSPKCLHVVDISENNLVELVREIRSSLGYIKGDFRTFVLDAGSVEFRSFFSAEGPYDYVLNLSAMKHVRSEKDPYSLMRLIRTNIFNTNQTIEQAIEQGCKKYFAVSTDKAANPVNMMGASKRIMEMFLMKYSLKMPISTARFANVAFSDGSLLHGFNQRLAKRQPISAPNDVKRYFVTPKESGELCLLSCLLGSNRDVFFPKLSAKLNLITFSEIAVKFLGLHGYEAVECGDENEARIKAHELISRRKWPCYFFKSDTTGEKDFEEFFTLKETIDMESFDSIGVIKNLPEVEETKLNTFEAEIARMLKKGDWQKQDLIELFNFMIPDFDHRETGKYLDGKM